MTARVELPREAYPDRPHRAAFYREALDKLNQLPGVERAALTSMVAAERRRIGATRRSCRETRGRGTQLPESTGAG